MSSRTIADPPADAAIQGLATEDRPLDRTVASVKERRPKRSKGFVAARSIALPLVIPAIVIGLWQYAGQRGLIADGLFPSFTDSIVALGDFLFGISEHPTPYSGDWIFALMDSSVRILSGYAVGAISAIVIGLLAGYFVTVRQAVNPMIDVLRPISITAWIPIALILFGIGNSPAIFLTGLAVFFPVYVNTLTGAQYAEGRLLRAAAMLGATRWQALLKVVVPATLPSIATGMRVGLAFAWTTVVVAEILGARSGLGYVLIDAYNQFRFDYVVACMISLGALGFLTDRLLVLAFKIPLRWVEHAAAA